jgi:hypothetical protein
MSYRKRQQMIMTLSFLGALCLLAQIGTWPAHAAAVTPELAAGIAMGSHHWLVWSLLFSGLVASIVTTLHRYRS